MVCKTLGGDASSLVVRELLSTSAIAWVITRPWVRGAQRLPGENPGVKLVSLEGRKILGGSAVSFGLGETLKTNAFSLCLGENLKRSAISLMQCEVPVRDATSLAEDKILVLRA